MLECSIRAYLNEDAGRDYSDRGIGGAIMAGSEHLGIQPRPREYEISDLLQRTVQQYERYMELADLADSLEVSESSYPTYAWDNPMGLVVVGESNADMV